MITPSFTIGIEEEYLLIHQDTLDLAAAPQALMDECVAALGNQVSPEFLRCQVEVGTKVCETVDEARQDLKRLRSAVAEIVGEQHPCPVKRIGLRDTFARSGRDHRELLQRYGMTAEHILEAARAIAA